MADTNPCLPQKGLSAFSGDCRLKAACIIKQYAQYCAPNCCSELLIFQDKLRDLHVLPVQIRALSSTDRRRTTTCPCKAHTQAQAAVASWHKAHTEAQAALASGRKAYTEAQAALASWRKAHTEAQAAVASGHAPRQALLLDRAAAVR